MPVIARFYGIAIRMYYREHGIAHFHAIYGNEAGVFAIATLDMIEGGLPRRIKRLVQEWGSDHQEALLEMWETQKFHPLPGLEGWLYK